MTKRFTAQIACAGIALIAVLLLCAPVFAAQDATFVITPPTTGGAPTGYRVYRDGTLVGPVISGQPIPAFFPTDTGTFALGFEAFNVTGAGPRYAASVAINPPAPGAIPKIVITVPCATASPPTCTVVVN